MSTSGGDSTTLFDSIVADFQAALENRETEDAFYATCANNNDFQVAIFNAIENNNLEHVLNLLLKWRRHLKVKGQGQQHLVLQFLPGLLLINLSQKREFKKVKF